MSDGDSIFKYQHVEKIVKNDNAFGGIYFLAFVGAAFYFIQQASSFWDGVVGVLKAIVWPGVIMFEVLKLLQL